VRLSEEVGAFCLAEGVEKTKAQWAAIATEEMAVNVSKYGYNKDKLKSIDVRVRINQDNYLTLCFRDDGVPFDPTVYSEAEKDTFRSSGIGLIRALAQSVEYSYVLGFNVTVITLDVG
ncbi:MAG: ATP-binding protein, partial [Eubacterium sp.]